MPNTASDGATPIIASSQLDTAGLLHRCGDDPELAVLVLAEFAKSYPNLLRRLDDGVRAGDATQIDHALHAIAGVAANVGANRVASDGIALRRRAAQVGADVLSLEIEEWRRAFERLPGEAREAAERLGRTAG